MSLPQTVILYTPDEYLELERQATERHEYLDGHIYEMAGESLAHSQICVNLAREVSTQLKGKRCQALSPNMKVRTGEKKLFSYPDLTIVCGQTIFHDVQRDVLLNPTVVFEVLSRSTEGFDRGEKFLRYRNNIETLTDYVLISQHIPLVEHYTRREDNRWLMTSLSGLDSALALPEIGCVLRLSEIYDRVEFPPETIDPESRIYEEPDGEN